MTRLRCVLSVGLLLTTLGCAPSKPAPKEAASATFKVVEMAAQPGEPAGMVTLAAGYGSGEAQALFLIEIDGERRRGKVDGRPDPGIEFAKGRFRHLHSSNPRPFLASLAKTLGAKAPSMSWQQAEVLPFEIAILGSHMSRDAMGGFSGRPSGDWVATKLFLANGEAEVYFNFETTSGDAEFSPKDEEYGNRVIEELSKVLW